MRYIHYTISNIGYILRLTWQMQKDYYVFWMLGVILMVADTWISIVFIRYVIELLTVGEIQGALLLSIVFPIILIFSGTASDMIRSAKENREEIFSNQLKAMLAEKQMQIPFEQLDNQAQRVRYDFARKAVNEAGVGLVLESLGSVLSNTVSMVGVLYVFSCLNLWMVLLLILVICINAVGTIRRMQYRYQESQEETPIERNLYYARDYLTGPVFAKEIRTFGLENYITQKIRTCIEAYFHLKQKTFRLYYKRFGWTYVMNGIQLVLVYWYLGSLLFQGSLSISDFTVLISAVLVFSGTMAGNITAIAEMVQTGKYTQSLKEFLQQEETDSIVHAPLPCMQDGFSFTLENVSFRYEEKAPFVLRHLSLEIHSGERLCIVGRNGEGKTTLIKLLMGLYHPTEGVIRLNGVDIRAYDPKEYLTLFSTVFQDFHIFAFRISENISLSHVVDQQQMKEALVKAGLWEKVHSLPQGAASPLTERMEEDGIDLSGGERQMLAMARAVYKNAPVCILDEPTAALSPQNEYAIYQQFDEIARDKTVLFISHRLASCRLADCIAVLSSGCVTEYGSHDELMQKNGLYASMFSMQASHYNVE